MLPEASKIITIKIKKIIVFASKAPKTDLKSENLPVASKAVIH